ncbi:MAG TPA: HAD hydrolase-like protein [Kofleriaceae bacterium]|nr:HAD hydrolase-like protein [Kofleriaceae bacterium]
MHVLYLFDIDGTLLRADGAGRRAFDRVMLAHHGIAQASHDIQFGGKTDRWLVDEVYQARLHRAARTAEVDAFIADYLVLLDEELQAKPLRVLPDVVACLRWLQQLPNVTLGVATGNVRRGAELKLAQAGLTDMFVFGGWGCDSADRPTLVQRAVERGRDLVPPAQRTNTFPIVVGDTVHDIAAARMAGAHACAVTTGGDSRSTLAAADVVFDGLGELPAWHAAKFPTATPFSIE